MLEPDWLASNGYRVLGVPANAGPKQVHAAAASLRRAASLGLQSALATDQPGLEVARRTETDIRAAVGRLENPAQRLQDRLFWFNCTADAARQDQLAPTNALEAHEAALRKLLAAVSASVHDGAVMLWADALRAWDVTLTPDTFWDWFQSVEIEADFEAAALPSEFDALRRRAVPLAGATLVSLGRSALDASDVALAGRIAGSLNSLADTGAWATTALGELLEPALAPFLARCGQIQSGLHATLIREDGAAARNAEPCASGLRRFRSEVGPGLDLLRSLAPADSDGLLRARDAAAECLASIAAAMTWTDDYVTADQLYREASVLAEGTIAAFAIEQTLEGIQKSVQFQRLRGAQQSAGPSPNRSQASHPRSDSHEAALAPLLELCDRVGSELEAKLKRVAGAASQNKGPCSLALKRFRNEITPALEGLLAATAESKQTHLRAREAAGRCLASIASATTWTDDFVYAEKLYTDALALADGTMATGMINNALKEIGESSRLQRFRGKAIQSAPGLFTLNGVGTTLYGHADLDAQTGSYVATLYFVILMFPILPIARYRVIEHPGRRFQFLGKQPFRPLDRWWLGLALGAILLLFLWSVLQAQTGHVGLFVGAASPAEVTTPSASGYVAPSADVSNPQSGAANTAADGAAPAVDTPPTAHDAAPDGTAGSGSGLMSIIDAGRARMTAIDSQLTDLKSEEEPLDRSMSTLKSEIDELDTQRNAGEQVDTSDYNSKVDEYNSTLEKSRNLESEYNNLVEEHNNLLAADRAMVSRYNGGER